MILCITGSFASGKTTLGQKFAEKGIKYFSCDAYIKTLRSEECIQREINKIINMNHCDINKLREIILNNSKIRSKIEALLYPLLEQKILSLCEKNIVIEIPLLFEKSWFHIGDKILTSYCRESIRMERALKKVPLKIFKAINKIQLPQYIKVMQSDYAIDTSFESNIDQIYNKTFNA